MMTKPPSSNPDQQDPKSPASSNTVIKIKSVSAGNGIHWLKEAMTIFAKSPWLWLSAGAMMFFGLLTLSAMLASISPPLALLASIPMSFLVAGAVYATQQTRKGAPFRIENLFYCLDHEPLPIVKVGVIYAAGSIAIGAISELLFSALGLSIPEIIIDDPANFRIPLELLLFFLINLALLLPLIMAYWFAPALVVLLGVHPWQAFKYSFKACQKNVLPFLLYGLYALGLIFVCLTLISFSGLIALPFAVILTLVFYCAAFAVSLISIYTALIDIFSEHFAKTGEIDSVSEPALDNSDNNDDKFVV